MSRGVDAGDGDRAVAASRLSRPKEAAGTESTGAVGRLDLLYSDAVEGVRLRGARGPADSLDRDMLGGTGMAAISGSSKASVDSCGC